MVAKLKAPGAGALGPLPAVPEGGGAELGVSVDGATGGGAGVALTRRDKKKKDAPHRNANCEKFKKSIDIDI